MISVIIPTLNAGPMLARSLAALLDANMRGLIAEVIVSDGGSEDDTVLIAEEAGAKIVTGEKGRGSQLIRGAEAARGEWLLFLHADTELSAGWEDAAATHIKRAFDRKAAVFRLAFDDEGIKPKIVSFGANFRARVLRMPYGDQGLLISRRHYEGLGGYKPYPLFEDLDLVRRITKAGGRGALRILGAVARTSAERYVREGYAMRVLRNARLVAAFYLGVPPKELARRYHARTRKTSHPDGKAALDRPGQNPPQ